MPHVLAEPHSAILYNSDYSPKPIKGNKARGNALPASSLDYRSILWKFYNGC